MGSKKINTINSSTVLMLGSGFPNALSHYFALILLACYTELLLLLVFVWMAGVVLLS